MTYNFMIINLIIIMCYTETDLEIINSFINNNIADYSILDDNHFEIKNDYRHCHIIGRDFRLGKHRIDLISKIINKTYNYENKWYLLNENFYMTVFDRLITIYYNDYIIKISEILPTEKIIIKNKLHQQIINEEFINYKFYYNKNK